MLSATSIRALPLPITRSPVSTFFESRLATRRWRRRSRSRTVAFTSKRPPGVGSLVVQKHVRTPGSGVSKDFRFAAAAESLVQGLARRLDHPNVTLSLLFVDVQYPPSYQLHLGVFHKLGLARHQQSAYIYMDRPFCHRKQ